jgi:hypothetical protein
MTTTTGAARESDLALAFRTVATNTSKLFWSAHAATLFVATVAILGAAMAAVMLGIT